jgi:hypothetical protein
VIISSNRSETLKTFPIKVLKKYYELTKKLPSGTGHIIDYSEKQSYYYLRDEHNNFEIKRGQNDDFQSLLDSFINNNIQETYFIIHQAYECWKAALEDLEFKEPAAVSDVFIVTIQLYPSDISEQTML